jgi:hypothetical protein
MRRILRKVAASGKTVTVDVRKRGGRGGKKEEEKEEAKNTQALFSVNIDDPENRPDLTHLPFLVPSLPQELGDTSTLAEPDVINELIANHV